MYVSAERDNDGNAGFHEVGASVKWLGWVGLLIATGCGGRTGAALSSTVPSCVPGEQIACACSNGATGAQFCAGTGTFAACQCTEDVGRSGGTRAGTDPGPGGSGNSGSTHANGVGGTLSNPSGMSGAGSGGGSGGTSASSAGLTFSSGSQTLVDLFVGDAGVLLIFSDEVRLVGLDGTTLKSVSAPREVTAAAFDGSLLVVADKAKFTSYDPNLEQLASANLAVTCSSGVLMDNHRFVCGQNVDWDRVYYTYDALEGTLLASSKAYTYDGIPMRRVPSTNQFVAVEVASSPANLFLFQMGTSGEVSYLGPGPFEISDSRAVYAFSGDPATQVIVDDGTMLEIDPSQCSQNTISSGCFNQVGALGTLSGAQRFIGMDSDLNGKIYALVDTSPSYDQFCKSGCLVEQIDVASRVVSSQAIYSLASAARIVNVRHDAQANALVVGYSTASAFSSSGTSGKHEVLSLPY